MNRLLVVLLAVVPLSAQPVLSLSAAPGRATTGRVRIHSGRQATTFADSTATEQGVFARVMAGGGWQTTLVLMNTGSTAVPFRQFFWGGDGNPRDFSVAGPDDAPLVTSALQSTLYPNSSMNLVLPDSGSGLQEGWSSLSYDPALGKVGGYAVIRHQGLAGATFEATVPLSTMLDFSLRMPFDNTTGYRTQLTLVNPVSNLAAQVALTYLNAKGVIVLIDAVNLNPGQQMTIVLPDTYPDLANKTGTVAIEGNLDHLSVFGMRYSAAYGAIAAIPLVN